MESKRHGAIGENRPGVSLRNRWNPGTELNNKLAIKALLEVVQSGLTNLGSGSDETESDSDSRREDQREGEGRGGVEKESKEVSGVRMWVKNCIAAEIAAFVE